MINYWNGKLQIITGYYSHTILQTWSTMWEVKNVAKVKSALDTDNELSAKNKIKTVWSIMKSKREAVHKSKHKLDKSWPLLFKCHSDCLSSQIQSKYVLAFNRHTFEKYQNKQKSEKIWVSLHVYFIKNKITNLNS